MFGRKKEEVQEMTVHTAQQGKKGNVKEYLDSMSTSSVALDLVVPNNISIKTIENI